MSKPKPIAVDLFAGAGGLSMGLTQAGFEVALANEIDANFAATYQLNHAGTRLLTCDVASVDFGEFAQELRASGRQVSLVSGGPPCQGFSTVGSKREHDGRNSLFFEFLRAVRELDAQFVLFENVAGFKSLYGGKAYRTLLDNLDEIGYDTVSGVLDASDFGLPQIRLRTIVAGWKRGLPRVQLPPPTHADSPDLFGAAEKLVLMDALSDLPPLEANDEKHAYDGPPRNEFQAACRASTEVLTEHNSANYGQRMRQILAAVPPGGSVEDLPIALRPKGYFKNTYARLHPDRPSPTITRNFGTPSSSRCIHPFQARALSTREGARLQGFPDDYQFVGSKGSKNLQIGNAVPPLLGLVVGRQIIEAIRASSPLAATG